ncbi:hypothetical protein CDD82_7488 [Ophiocordyceps australis]|uniref:Uncharacterized protein n=1 Tax=Ophiocordyceps australis TaxID=1399860 RepID=A0A2C5Y231_9HYPO|nr:hypothetical protein CDD82_7488 [Ophiocordyceps australis]
MLADETKTCGAVEACVCKGKVEMKGGKRKRREREECFKTSKEQETLETWRRKGQAVWYPRPGKWLAAGTDEDEESKQGGEKAEGEAKGEKVK